jgi:guanylate kinase
MIFLITDSVEELENRLKTRKTEKPEELKLRIATATQELNRVVEFDYVVPNRDSRLDEAVDIIESIIAAEHHRVKHRKVTL